MIDKQFSRVKLNLTKKMQGRAELLVMVDEVLAMPAFQLFTEMETYQGMVWNATLVFIEMGVNDAHVTVLDVIAETLDGQNA